MSATATRGSITRRQARRRQLRRTLITLAAVSVLGTSARALPAAPQPAPQTTPGSAGSAASVRTVVPAIHMGSAAIDLSTPAGAQPERVLLTGRSGIPLAYRPAALSVAPGPGMSTAETRRLLDAGGLRVDYAAGATTCGKDPRWGLPLTPTHLDAAGAPTPTTAEKLAADTSAQVCVKTSSKLSQAQLIGAFAGRSLLLRTRWDSTTPAPSTWSATTMWEVPYVVPLPPALAPKGKPACAPARKRSLNINWAWPNATAPPAKSAISRWSILVRPAVGKGEWKLLADTRGGSADRSERVYAAAFRAAKLAPGDYDLAVRAYPFAKDTTRYVDSANTWRVRVPKRGAPTCGPVGTNDTALVAGYGGLLQ
ncbi:hypothetical protein [Gephyromycinifex aptenodytis]|uniref:hypothetical protein n=1 Tax=Gephyromycinifex aptenodytis TaxID=2716227 RepID=UPI00144525A6|nr:hypothetical protein [Gephyromycinifex aptenodytis]